MRITALKQNLAAVVASMDDILQAAANDDNRDLTAEEQATFDGHLAEADKLKASIKREEDLLALKSSAAKPIDLPQGQQPKVPAQAADKLEKGIMVARIAIAIAEVGPKGDQRALAAHAQEVWGDETGQIVANMQQTTGANGGYLVDTAYSKDFIDFLRPNVVIRRMGATPVPMPDGNLTMRKQTGASTAGYVGERVPAPTTDLQIGNLNMSAKKLMALVPITNQLLRRASMDVDLLVRNDLVTSAGIKEDQQFLRGVGSATAPTGVRNLVNAGNVIPAAGASDLVTVTSDLAKLKLAVINANVPLISCGYIMSPTTHSFLENIRDANGNKAFPEVAEGRLGIYPIGVTTSVPDNLGGGGNETEIYFGAFAHFLIGDTYQVTLAASAEAAYDDGGVMRAAFSNDETVIRLIEEHDTQLRYDKAFAVLTGVIWKP